MVPFWYGLFKFLHVGFSVAWVGGGVAMLMLALMAERRRDNGDYVRIVQSVAALARSFFMPASIGALVSGLVAAAIGHWWGYMWVYLGLAGFAGSAYVGAALLGPMAGRLRPLAAAGPTPDALSLSRQIMTLAKFDYVLLFAVIADMVFKPDWSNALTWLILLAIVAVAGYFYLYLPRGRATAMSTDISGV